MNRIKKKKKKSFSINSRAILVNKEAVCSFIRLFSKDPGKERERLYYPLEDEK